MRDIMYGTYKRNYKDRGFLVLITYSIVYKRSSIFQNNKESNNDMTYGMQPT